MKRNLFFVIQQWLQYRLPDVVKTKQEMSLFGKKQEAVTV